VNRCRWNAALFRCFYVSSKVEPLLRQVDPCSLIARIEGAICLIGAAGCKDATLLGIVKYPPQNTHSTNPATHSSAGFSWMQQPVNSALLWRPQDAGGSLQRGHRKMHGTGRF
jgi:hypothetical protein